MVAFFEKTSGGDTGLDMVRTGTLGRKATGMRRVR